MDASSNYLNRELSWLEFNQRVLEQAWCASNPLLERIKFLAISASNLDEFFRVRVGGLSLAAKSHAEQQHAAQWDPAAQIRAIGQRVRVMSDDQYRCLLQELEPELAGHQIRRARPEHLSGAQLEHLRAWFEEVALAVLAPIAVQHSPHVPFPMLVGCPVCLGVRLSSQGCLTTPGREGVDDPETRFAVIPLCAALKRFVTVPSDEQYQYLLLEDVLGMFVDQFFPGQQIVECAPFRVTRNADVELNENEMSDLLTGMQKFLEARKTSDCVRLEVAESTSQQLTDWLCCKLHLDEADVYRVPGPLELSAFMALAALPGYGQLKDEPWPPQPSPDFPPGENIFDLIAQQDRLLLHPYQSFDPVVQMVQVAAADPQVIAIKQTLYRTGHDSAVVKALAAAASEGKHVTVIVELKARFDEAQNITWAQQLERSGVNVIYGVRGLKTHAKICIVVRRQPDGVRRYLHFGTGNYNESTARLYSDVSYFTCDEQLGLDSVHFFNAITGLSAPQPMQALVPAPTHLRHRLLEMIEIETRHALQERPARIVAKVNSLVDQELIDALYRASQAGVIVELNVRGICCLKAQVEGLSENIRVVSIVDRFLEHSRILYFHHGGDHLVFLSSADWMGRNLDRRVELMVPVSDVLCKTRLIRTLEVYFQDNVKARWMGADGSYQAAADGGEPVRSQQYLYLEARDAIRAQQQSTTTRFEAHRREKENN